MSNLEKKIVEVINHEFYYNDERCKVLAIEITGDVIEAKYTVDGVNCVHTIVFG